MAHKNNIYFIKSNRILMNEPRLLLLFLYITQTLGFYYTCYSSYDAGNCGNHYNCCDGYGSCALGFYECEIPMG
jgi:hypothetical protein